MTVTHVGGRFLAPALCYAVVAELERSAVWQWGEITRDGRAQVDTDFRRAQWCAVPASCEAIVAERLLAIGRGLRAVFGPLRTFEGPNLLRYRPGDFFRPHADVDSRIRVRPRRVTITAFLNDGEFDGGVLRIWPSGRRPIDIPATTGRFVAFPAPTVHEVTPVSRASPRASERGGAVSRASPRASERGGAVSRASPRASERGGAVSRASPRASERGGAGGGNRYTLVAWMH